MDKLPDSVRIGCSGPARLLYPLILMFGQFRHIDATFCNKSFLDWAGRMVLAKSNSDVSPIGTQGWPLFENQIFLELFESL